MLNLTLEAVARAVGGQRRGDDAAVRSVSIDTRTLEAGALFVALRGERHDGHALLAQARAAGAVAALVERFVDDALPQVLVADTERALGDLAAAVRAQRTACAVGITGSNGKTTVKTLTAAILARHGRTHVNAGNYNNEIGLPLSVLAMPADTEYAVLEMGAGKPGDIAYLARIAQPRVGLVNNVAAAHLERMGSLDGVAQTKGALIEALPADGVAVVNLDDAFADRFVALAGSRRVLRFGLGADADVSAHFGNGTDSRFTLVTPRGRIDVDLPLPGRHNVLNALAAASLALAAAPDIALDALRDGLENAPPVAGRLAGRAHASGAWIYDDSYNANPGSFAAAIATLAAWPGPRVLVMGDMKELGAEAEALHARVGELARASGIEQLHAVGALSAAAVAAFGPGAVHHADQHALTAAVRAELAPGVGVLIKGSRSSAMDRVVAALFATDGEPGGERHAA